MTDPISAQVIDQRIVARLDLAANELDKIGTLSLPTLVRQAASEIQHAADHIDAQAATIKALVEALGKLCFEVAGLQAFETEVRREIGNTNYAAIMTRLEDGGKALAAAKEPT